MIVLMLLVGRPERAVPLSWALGLASLAYWPFTTAGLVVDHHLRLTQLVPLQHGCYFAMGMALSRIRGSRVPAEVIALAALCLLASPFQVRAAASGEELPQAVLRWWPLAWGVFGLCVIGIALAMWLRVPIARGVRPGTARVLRLMGLVTYPLYLVHAPLGYAVIGLAVAGGMTVHAAGLLAVIIALLAALAIAVWLEPPLHRLVAEGAGRVLRPVAVASR